jgi:hypothetical protein
VTPLEMREQIDNQIRERIAKHGWTHIGVFNTEETPADEFGPPFTYSVGLTERGMPEIVILGLPPKMAMGLINDTVHMWTEEGVSAFNVPVQGILKGMPVMYLEVEPEKESWYFSATRRFYGDRVKPVQMIWPDEDGRFPWQEGFNPKFLPHQPLLGKPQLFS